MHCKFTVVLQCTHCKKYKNYTVLCIVNLQWEGAPFLLCHCISPTRFYNGFTVGHCIIHCKIYSGFTVSRAVLQ